METERVAANGEESLAGMVEHCLDSPSAHRLFAILTTISRLGLTVRLEFIDLARQPRHPDQQARPLAAVTLTGDAREFTAVVDRLRENDERPGNGRGTQNTTPAVGVPS